jgi:hypothetical protein
VNRHMLRAMRNVVVLTAVAVVSVSSAAAADGFVTLDRQDDISSVGLEGSYIALAGNPAPANLRFDLHGEYIDRSSGFGGYLTLPYAFLGASDVTSQVSALGDLELGGVYAHHFGEVTAVFHVGLTLPTQANGLATGSTTQVPLPNNTASYDAFIGARVTDFFLSVEDGVSLRFGGAMIYRHNAVLARVELGLDANLSNNLGGGIHGSVDNAVRISGGIGANLGQTLIMAELVNLFDSSLDVSNNGSSWRSDAAISLRYVGGRAHPYIAAVLGLDSETRDVANVAVTIGIDTVIR